ncbi:hypothetical protein BD414DRAFT_94047 [Trametes punicea]|nr:hypothetical protein BD414DRAFT_94047 [Trametes punicea]
MRPPKPFLDPPQAAGPSSSSSSSRIFSRSSKRPSRFSAKQAVSPGSLSDPSSGFLALLITLAGSASADARPLDSDSPPEFLCPRLHAWSLPESQPSSSAAPASPSWSWEPCDASEAAAYVDLSFGRRKRRTRRSTNIADKYVEGPDGRWRKADSWELYGSSSCAASGCMDQPEATDYPVQDDQVSPSAEAVTTSSTPSASASPNLPTGWDKTREEDNMTGMILGLALTLAVSLILFMMFVVRWRHKRRARQRRDAEKTSGVNVDVSEEAKRARTQQRLWARASAKWVANVRQSARRRRKRKAAAKDADGRALREAHVSSSALSLACSASAFSMNARQSAPSSLRSTRSRSPSPDTIDPHKQRADVHSAPHHPPAYPEGSSSAFQSSYSHWHSHPLDIAPGSLHVTDIPPPDSPPPCPADGSPPPSLSPLPYEPPPHSAHVAIDDKAVLARMAQFASAPLPQSPHTGSGDVDEGVRGPSLPGGPRGGSSELRPSVPVLEDDPFEDALCPDIDSLDLNVHSHTRPDRHQPKLGFLAPHDTFPSPPSPLPHGASACGLGSPPLRCSAPVHVMDVIRAMDGTQEEAEVPSYAEDVLRHRPLVLPPPPGKVPMVGPTFYEYRDEFERDVATVEPVSGPSAPPFEYDYALPPSSIVDATAAAPSAPPLESVSAEAPVDSKALIPSAPPLAYEDEVANQVEVEDFGPPFPLSLSCAPTRSSSRSSSSSRVRLGCLRDVGSTRGPDGGYTLSSSHSSSAGHRGIPDARRLPHNGNTFTNADADEGENESENTGTSATAPPRYLP